MTMTNTIKSVSDFNPMWAFFPTDASPVAAPASKLGGMGARHFQGARPSKSHRFLPLRTGKCQFFHDFIESCPIFS